MSDETEIDCRHWHDGPPPSEGWWPASTGREHGRYRFFINGIGWSEVAYEDDSLQRVAQSASFVGCNNYRVQWRLRPADWPARSLT